MMTLSRYKLLAEVRKQLLEAQVGEVDKKIARWDEMIEVEIKPLKNNYMEGLVKDD